MKNVIDIQDAEAEGGEGVFVEEKTKCYDDN
jgi:hypothetical protein